MENNHGVYTEVSYNDFSNKERAQSKLITTFPLIFVGLPLVYYVQNARDEINRNYIKPI